MSERRRPTHTVIVPVAHLLPALAELILDGCTFTCERSPNTSDVWYVGVFTDGVAVLGRVFGPMADVGTLGEWSDQDLKVDGEA